MRVRAPALLAAVSLIAAVAACGGGEISDRDARRPSRPASPRPSPPATPAPAARCVLAPPPTGIYLAAFPDFTSDERNEDDVTAAHVDDFERVAGKAVVWAYFSDHWYDGIHFPAAEVDVVRRHGEVPFIRLMPWAREGEDRPSRYPMRDILDGRFDADLRAWFRAAAAVPGPLLVEFAAEVNGDWFPWNGRWNGGESAGPERFRAAYRHLVDLSRQEAARNLTWFFHADVSSVPDEGWNRIEAYFPGDDVVDWVGLSVYGPQGAEEAESWETFAAILDGDDAYHRVAEMTAKPLAVLETAVVEGKPGAKAVWIRDLFGALSAGRYPRVKAVAWWQERWEADDGPHDLRMNSTPEAEQAFRDAVAVPYFVTTPVFEGACP